VCTPCGHVFHMQCVLQWFESKKNCPQCRHTANEKNIRKVFLSEVDGGEEENSDVLQNKLDAAQFKVRSLTQEKESYKTKFNQATEHNAKLKEEVKKIELSKRKAEDNSHEYKAQVRFLKEERNQYEKYQSDAEKYKLELENYKVIKRVINESTNDVNMLLHERGCFDRESKDLAFLVVQLKKTVVDLKRHKSLAQKIVEEAHLSTDTHRLTIKSQAVQISELQAVNNSNTQEIQRLQDHLLLLQDENCKLKAKSETRALSLNHESASDEDLFNMEDEETFSLSPSNSSTKVPAAAASEVKTGQKRKPFAELRNDPVVKRPKCKTDLMEIGTHKSSCGPVFDGFGGRSKPDVFPEPLRKLKKPVRRTSNVSTKVQKQRNVMNKFFGSFDSP